MCLKSLCLGQGLSGELFSFAAFWASLPAFALLSPRIAPSRLSSVCQASVISSLALMFDLSPCIVRHLLSLPLSLNSLWHHTIYFYCSIWWFRVQFGSLSGTVWQPGLLRVQLRLAAWECLPFRHIRNPTPFHCILGFTKVFYCIPLKFVPQNQNLTCDTLTQVGIWEPEDSSGYPAGLWEEPAEGGSGQSTYVGADSQERRGWNRETQEGAVHDEKGGTWEKGWIQMGSLAKEGGSLWSTV